MKTLSIINLKGGVGKTCTAVNMAYELHRRGLKVLLIDNDKQGNLSKAYGAYNAEEMAAASKLLSGEWNEAKELIQKTDYENIDIIAANMSLMGATWKLTASAEGNQLEKFKKLPAAKMDGKTIQETYDYCIIDNPPDIGLNVVNALVISDEVIVPVKIDEWALEGLDILKDQINEVKAYNPGIKLSGVLVTIYQNTDGEAAGKEWLEKQNDIVVLGKVRYSKKVAESTFLFKPIYEYSPTCSAAQDYKKFVTMYTGIER